MEREMSEAERFGGRVMGDLADFDWRLPADPESSPAPLFQITMSIAYSPETGQVDIDGSFRGGADGRMLLEIAAAQLAKEFPKP